jgi:hypothetical protein
LQGRPGESGATQALGATRRFVLNQLFFHLIGSVDAGTRGPVSGAAAEQAAAWCEYLAAHARQLYGAVTDVARVAAALLATRLAGGGWRARSARAGVV